MFQKSQIKRLEEISNGLCGVNFESANKIQRFLLDLCKSPVVLMFFSLHIIPGHPHKEATTSVQFLILFPFVCIVAEHVMLNTQL